MWQFQFIYLFILGDQYKVRQNELNSRTLNLSVWHAEPLARNVFLGEVEVALGRWDWTCTQPLWQDLQPRVTHTHTHTHKCTHCGQFSRNISTIIFWDCFMAMIKILERKKTPGHAQIDPLLATLNQNGRLHVSFFFFYGLLMVTPTKFHIAQSN